MKDRHEVSTAGENRRPVTGGKLDADAHGGAAPRFPSAASLSHSSRPRSCLTPIATTSFAPGTVAEEPKRCTGTVQVVRGDWDMVRLCGEPIPINADRCPECGTPAEEPDATYTITPAQELSLAEVQLKCVMADWLHSRQLRRLREVLRAIKSARDGLA
jgi:hypothetical protein